MREHVARLDYLDSAEKNHNKRRHPERPSQDPPRGVVFYPHPSASQGQSSSRGIYVHPHVVVSQQQSGYVTTSERQGPVVYLHPAVSYMGTRTSGGRDGVSRSTREMERPTRKYQATVEDEQV